MTLNSIWWCGSCPGALRKVEYPFVTINPRFTLTSNGYTCYGPIYGPNRTVQSFTKDYHQKLFETVQPWTNYLLHRTCPWCNGYSRRKWTRRHEFKSWTRLIAFHIELLPLRKIWIQLFSLQLWVNSRADWFFSLGEATSLGEGKLRIKSC